MPKKLEQKLRHQATKKGLKGKRKNAYVYGTMREKTDWEPHKKKKLSLDAMKRYLNKNKKKG